MGDEETKSLSGFTSEKTSEVGDFVSGIDETD